MAPKPTGHFLKLLRNAMKENKQVQAYIVPSGDEHQVSVIYITIFTHSLIHACEQSRGFFSVFRAYAFNLKFFAAIVNNILSR